LVAEEEGALTCDTAAHLISELKLRPPHFTVCCSRASDSGPVPFSQNFFVTCHCAGDM